MTEQATAENVVQIEPAAPAPKPELVAAGASAPVVSVRAAELTREEARLAQIEADLSIITAELEGLAARKSELETVVQAVRAKITVLEEPDIEVAK